ncbi:hypothetical protein BC829DRAFT_385630 [Chytridium lagenaria]|nr:hypothetical protein BC829DRAFT_385630 [Chytridium lagenaria]
MRLSISLLALYIACIASSSSVIAVPRRSIENAQSPPALAPVVEAEDIAPSIPASASLDATDFSDIQDTIEALYPGNKQSASSGSVVTSTSLINSASSAVDVNPAVSASKSVSVPLDATDFADIQNTIDAVYPGNQQEKSSAEIVAPVVVSASSLSKSAPPAAGDNVAIAASKFPSVSLDAVDFADIQNTIEAVYPGNKPVAVVETSSPPVAASLIKSTPSLSAGGVKEASSPAPIGLQDYSQQLAADWKTIRSAITAIRKASSTGLISAETALNALADITEQVSLLEENAASLVSSTEVNADENVLQNVRAGLGWINGVTEKTAKELTKLKLVPADTSSGNNLLGGFKNPLDIIKKSVDAVRNIGQKVNAAIAKPEVKRAANGVANVAETVASISDVVGNILGVVSLIPGTQAVTVPATGIVAAVGQIARVVDGIAKGVSDASDKAAASQTNDVAAPPVESTPVIADVEAEATAGSIPDSTNLESGATVSAETPVTPVPAANNGDVTPSVYNTVVPDPTDPESGVVAPVVASPSPSPKNKKRKGPKRSKESKTFTTSAAQPNPTAFA